MIKLNYEQIKQENTQLCWRAITNIFSEFYTGSLYFIGAPGENAPADAMTGISLATGQNIHDVSINMTDISNKISRNVLLYACLDYGGVYHAVVIVAVDGNTFCIYDPYEDLEQWHAFNGNNQYRDLTSGNLFKIYNIAAVE